MAVLLILLALAVPSMQRLVDSRRLTAAANEFLAAVHLTRSEAIHRGERVDMLAVDDDWRRGWTVFVDRNRNRQPDAGDDIVIRHAAFADRLQIASRMLDDSPRYLAYDASGRSRTDASAQQPQSGTVRFMLGEQRRNIVLNMLGRPRICTPPPGTDSC